MSMIDMGAIEYFMSFWRIVELFAIGAGIAAQFIYMSQRSYTGAYFYQLYRFRNSSPIIIITTNIECMERSCLDETKPRKVSRAHQIGSDELVRKSSTDVP